MLLSSGTPQRGGKKEPEKGERGKRSLAWKNATTDEKLCQEKTEPERARKIVVERTVNCKPSLPEAKDAKGQKKGDASYRGGGGIATKGDFHRFGESKYRKKKGGGRHTGIRWDRFPRGREKQQQGGGREILKPPQTEIKGKRGLGREHSSMRTHHARREYAQHPRINGGAKKKGHLGRRDLRQSP